MAGRQPAPKLSKVTIALSVMAHVAALIVLTVLVQSRTNDAAADAASVELMFVPAQASLPAAATPARDFAVADTPVARDAPTQKEEPIPAPAAEPAASVATRESAVADTSAASDERVPSQTPVPVPTVAPTDAAAPDALPVPPVPHETVANETVPARLTPERPLAPPKRAITARPQARMASQPLAPAHASEPAPAETRSSIAGAVSFAATAQIIPPRPVAGMESNRAPVYPELARRRGEEGRVLLRVNVSADGSPLDVAVLETSGHQSLDAAALGAIRQWRFVPATQAGRAVAAEADVPVRFRLDN